jgi:uncharacterized SAM-binding protein YcdF (DUF218 family)
MFFFKKAVSGFIMPLPICLGLLIVGCIFLLKDKIKLAKYFIFIGVALLSILCITPVSHWALSALENDFEKFECSSEQIKTNVPLFIAVLGGGVKSNPELPDISKIAGASLNRLFEGIRIHKCFSGSKLIIFGGTAFGPIADSTVMARVARKYGVQEHDLVLFKNEKDTISSIRRLKKYVKNEQLIVVTSGFHMRRVMGMFRKLQMHPVPAPTDYYCIKSQKPVFFEFVPSLHKLWKAHIVAHEYLGILWGKLCGQI